MKPAGGRFDEDTYARARKWREEQEAKASAPKPAAKPAAKVPSKQRVSNPVSKQSMERAQDMRHMQDTISAAEKGTARMATDRKNAMAADEQRKRTRAKLAMEDKAPKSSVPATRPMTKPYMPEMPATREPRMMAATPRKKPAAAPAAEKRSLFGRNPRGMTPAQARAKRGTR